MSTFSPKAHLRDSVLLTQGLLAKDLKAVAEDKANDSPGGLARPALSLVAECGAVNRTFATRIETGAFPERPSEEERAAFLASFNTVEKALQFLEEETQHLVKAIDTVDEDSLSEIIDTPLGKLSLFGLAEFAAMHMMYHDGQINYIHSLHGDSEMHWS